MINIKEKIKTITKVIIYAVLLIVLVIGCLYLYAFFSPKIEIRTNGNFYLYDKNSELVYQGSSSSKWVDINNINENLKNATISVEDKNFYRHQGFDYLRILRAVVVNFKNNTVLEGASTISQQYVKNMYLSFEKTWQRKIEEAMLTLELEVHYSKDEILEGYLNTINYGQGNYGIEDAAHYYFNKSANDLTLEESCILAGIPRSPANYNPLSNYELSIKRAKIVAETMVNNKYITKEEYDNLFKEDIAIYGKRENNNLQTLMYYQDAVLEELQTLDNIPTSLVSSGGLKIYTNLDLKKQEALENAVINDMKDDNMQVASLYVDPKTGSVEALVGGKNYSKSQYNRVTQSKRQVGSTIKPFLYYSALTNGLTMASSFSSEPTTFSFSNNQTYSPTNYGNIYANKDISMASAVAYSDNVFAVKTHLFLGEENLVNTMKLTGLKQGLSAIPSLALGSVEINMLDYAKSYVALASGGYSREIHLIDKVEDMNGNLLYKFNSNDQMVLNYNYVYIINEMLTNTYNTSFIDYTTPTAISLKGRLTHKYSIKTGTTDNDHWIVGYNPEALLLVWTGDDYNNDASGYSKITKNIWADAMEEMLAKEQEVNWYNKPDNVVGVPLDPLSGEYSNSKKSSMYYFVKGSEPIYYLN